MAEIVPVVLVVVGIIGLACIAWAVLGERR